MNEKILADDIPCGLRGWSRLRLRLPLRLVIGLLTTPSSSETQIYGSFSHCHLLPTWTKPPVTGVARKNRKADLYPNDLAPSRQAGATRVLIYRVQAFAMDQISATGGTIFVVNIHPSGWVAFRLQWSSGRLGDTEQYQQESFFWVITRCCASRISMNFELFFKWWWPLEWTLVWDESHCKHRCKGVSTGRRNVLGDLVFEIVRVPSSKWDCKIQRIS
jgi:hypothetical protein